MLLPILAVLGVLVVAVLVLAALRPADFRIVRSGSIQAPPAAVFGRVNDLRQFQDWSPWAKLDPTMKLTFSGPAAGVGCASAWEGNNKVGAGRMTITESRPAELVGMRLEFLRPFKATNTTEFTFRPDGSRTVVEWSMTGRHNFVSKIFCLFMNMDRMVGRDFEKGLAQLKSLAEAKP
jgi:uncharacterized protein YndB with AHSA1/START domain